MMIVMEVDFVRAAIVGCRRLESAAEPRGGAPAGHTATLRLCPNVNTWSGPTTQQSVTLDYIIIYLFIYPWFIQPRRQYLRLYSHKW
jgi:hypothetical protein